MTALSARFVRKSPVLDETQHDVAWYCGPNPLIHATEPHDRSGIDPLQQQFRMYNKVVPAVEKRTLTG
jgi:hypothetical protein